MKKLYLILAVLGAIFPYLYFFDFFAVYGLRFSTLIGGLFDNGAAAGFTVDLLISSLVFWVYMFQQRRKEKGPNPGPFIVINLLIGLSCALPAYLYAREQ